MAKAATFAGQECLELTGGLATLVEPDLATLAAGRIDVEVAATGPAFPGIAFQVADRENFELAYCQPHSSGQWDALQYDPVFRGSNTWQVYHGAGFQRSAVVPIGEWFTLRLDFAAERAAIRVGDQAPLVVGQLASGQRTGGIGLWTFLPAYFRNLRVHAGDQQGDGLDVPQVSPPAPGAIMAWECAGQGVLRCEPHGVLNLNRYLPLAAGEAILTRRFSLEREAVVEVG